MYYSCLIDNKIDYLTGNTNVTIKLTNIYNLDDYTEFENIQLMLDSLVGGEEITIYSHGLDKLGFMILDFLILNGFEEDPKIATSPERIIGKKSKNKYKYLADELNNDFIKFSFVYYGTLFILYNSKFQINKNLDKIAEGFGIDKVKYKDKLLAKVLNEYFNSCKENGKLIKATSSSTDFEYLVNTVPDFIEYFGAPYTGRYCRKFKFNFGDEISVPRFSYTGTRNGDIFRPLDYFRLCYASGILYNARNKEHYNGISLDVNSEYAYVMHSKSGNYYPIKGATYHKKDDFDEDFFEENKSKLLFMIRIRISSLKLKQGKFDFLHNANFIRLYDNDKEIYSLTSVDYWMFKDNYESEYDIIDFCTFDSRKGIFDNYIDEQYNIKMNSSGVKRYISKMSINCIGGKFAAKPKSKSHFVKNTYGEWIREIISEPEDNNDLRCNYIPVACFITAYARKYIVEQAEKFIDDVSHIDVDSLHIANCTVKEAFEKININDKELGALKVESEWDYAYFSNKKCYITLKDNKIDMFKYAGLDDNIKKELLKTFSVETILDAVKENKLTMLWRYCREY